MGILDRLRKGLARTREGLAARLGGLIPSAGDAAAAADFYERLEEALLTADVGVTAASELAQGVRERLRGRAPADLGALKAALRDQILGMEPPAQAAPEDESRPRVIVVVGVNGGGKTTTVGKLAHMLGLQGRKGVIAAADTFRAAAIEQVGTWAGRVGVDLVRHKGGADPSAVVYDAIMAARHRNADFVLIDTAGRLHTKTPLMKELEKIHRIAGREVPGAPHESLLVVDATTGQNGVVQAREFLKAGRITGLVLTKLDGTARGGVAIGISRTLGIPLRYVGVGEGVEDLLPFSLNDYLEGILGDASLTAPESRPPGGSRGQ
ncbi:MAG TPA: signal recognition particle-docking protein FtsY [Candidatus Saccharimonadales bacterium]|nr:signal recognition particle-docking protein FtsY [Candidatus Saccharimonadales bacterium]